MRDIMFRGKSLEGSRMLYGKILQSNFSTFIVTAVNTINGDKIESVHYDEIDPKTTGEFSGVEDVKEKQIFEGDIIKSCFKDGGEVNSKYLVVEFKDGRFITKELYRDYWLEKKEEGGLLLKHGIVKSYKGEIYPLNKSFTTHWTEIVGNIHDNPEFLEI